MGRENVRFCVIVPGYQEAGRIGKVVAGISEHCAHVIVVDDGSSDDTGKEAREAGAVVLTHDVNKGKGVSLETGLDYALQEGFAFVITMDADGQHSPDDISGFVESYVRDGTKALVGSRMDNTHAMPFVRRQTNRFMSWLLSRKMGQRVPDTQSGFRLYHRDVIPFVHSDSSRFAAESEVLLNLSANGVKIGAVPIQVIYGDEKSKINPLVDAFRFFSALSAYDRKHSKKG